MNKEAEESRNLCDQLLRALAPRPEDYCPCELTGQFPDGLPCPVHSSGKTPAAGSDDPKANGTYPTYGNDAKNERESGL
jgi:hypothetical protein